MHPATAATLAAPVAAPCSIGELVVRALAREPEAVAFVAGERHVRYGECAQGIAQAMERLDALGLRAGDTVAQLAGNRPEQWLLTAACYLMGLRSVAVPAGLAPQAQAALLQDVEARVVVVDGLRLDSRLRALLSPIPRHSCGGGHAVLLYSHDPDAPWPCFWSGTTTSPAPLRNRADPASIVRLAYTRGTTGPRKGVLLSARALAATALVSLADVPWPQRPVVLCPEPIAGGFGNFIVPALLRGGTVVLQEGFEPGRFMEALQRHRASVALLFPHSLKQLLAAPEVAAQDATSLQLLVYSGGCLCDAEIERAHRRYGPVLCQVHGQTECPKAFSVLRPADHASARAATRRSLGTPCTGMQVAILREDLSPCAPGEAGELCVRGPAVASGYWRQPTLTAHALRGGWWHSGDRCRLDERGYLHFVERMAPPAQDASIA